MFLLFVLFFSNAMANTADPDPCGITKTIQANEWTQIGIPCEAPAVENTVEAVISDDMTGTYGTQWTMFSFDPATNAYQHIGLEDSLEVGKGYWIIQLNQPATLDMPVGSQPISLESSTQCLTSGCFEAALVTTGDDRYQMLANPFYHSVEGTDLRVNTGSESGLTLQEADAETLANKIWSHNGVNYDELQNQPIPPWTGIWLATLSTASINPPPKLLFPTTNVVKNEKTLVLHGSSHPDPTVDTSTIGAYTLANGKIVNVVPIGYNIPNHVIGADIASIQAIGEAADIVVAADGVLGAAGTLADPIHINELNAKIAGRNNLNIVFRGGEHVYTSITRNWEIIIEGDNNTFDAYQNEKVIISGKDRTPTATTSVGGGSGGLHIKGNGNLWQRISVTKMPFIGMRIDGNNNTFQAMQVYKCYGSGVAFYDDLSANTHQGLGGSHNIFRHSYIYLNSGAGVVEHPDYPGRYDDGGNSDGIVSAKGTVGNIWENMTIWKNSDDGFDFWISKDSIVRNSISAFHGLGSGDGNGFKFGGRAATSEGILIGDSGKVINCLSFEESEEAFSNNSGINSKVRNVTAISGGSSNIWIGPSSELIDSISANGSDYLEGTILNFAQGVTLDEFMSVDPLSPDFARPTAASDLENQGTYKGLFSKASTTN